jgi:carbon-monoxide dehydrogenase medium subunit
MKLWQEFLIPGSISEAVQALTSAPSSVCLIAGGTDLMLDIQQGRHSAIHTMVDVTSIPELNQLEIRGGDLYIGASVVLSQIAISPLVVEHARALSEACSLIGGPQVRNVATLGGNVAHALPAADGTIAMMCLDTRVLVASRENTRSIPLQEMFLGAGRSALKLKEEMIVGFSIPLKKQAQGSAFKRIMRAQGIALPIINISVWLKREREIISDLRIAIGPSGATPRRITLVEDLLRGREVPTGNDLEVLNELLDQINFRTSPQRATAEYRHHLVKDLLVDTIMEAWKRAG